MKKSILIVVLGIICVACSNWLDVAPKTERPEKDLFATETGFKDALTGVYLELMNDHAYGEYLTMSKIEFLVSFWNTNTNTAEEALSFHNYKDANAEGVIKKIYERLYKAILAANAILEYVDQKKNLFPAGHYEAVKGECLAIRAMCHFDLLRLFGPVPTVTDKTPILSYVTMVSTDVNRHLSFAEYKEMLYADLVAAEGLLKEHLNQQTTIKDDYFKYRNIRMNWYAVKGLWARVHLWFGETKEAYENAMAVIGAEDVSGKRVFRLGTTEDFNVKDYALRCEQVLSIYRYDMYNKYTDLFKGNALYKGTKERTVKKDLFGNTGSDIRENDLWELVTVSGKSYYVLRKYQVAQKITQENPEYRYLPLLRLSEMYLIAIETGDKNQVEELWEEFTTKRNIATTSLPESREERLTLLVPEYRKEFYGEGQVFYLYKRANLAVEDKTMWLWAPVKINLNYVLPLPKTEVINN